MTLHIEVYGAGVPALFVHGSFGWCTEAFERQRELADGYRIHLLDRAGYGDSPAPDEVGWPTDMHDVAGVLGDLGTAHLVGQSYGGVVALLAAGLRAESVRSLVVIEPPLLGAAPHDPHAASLADALRRLDRRAPSLDTLGYFAEWSRVVLGRDHAAIEAMSASWSPRDWAAVESSRRERSPVDAPVDFTALAALDIPKVVVVGGWPGDGGTAPAGSPARHGTGRAFRAVAETVAARIGAEVVEFDRSAHNPQLQQPDEFNALLRRVWS